MVSFLKAWRISVKCQPLDMHAHVIHYVIRFSVASNTLKMVLGFTFYCADRQPLWKTITKEVRLYQPALLY